MKTKNQNDILISLVDDTVASTSELSDFSVGSAVRTIYDAVASEQETMYTMTDDGIKEGIKSGLMSAFGFTRKPAQPAYGEVTIEFYSPLTRDIIIDKGARFNLHNNNSFYFETREPYVISQGQRTANVTVYCSDIGEAGNVGAYEIDSSMTALYNVSRIYNQEDFITGNLGETYEQAQKRFQLFIESRGRATKSSLMYAALSVPHIEVAYVYETVGRVFIYASDKQGNLSSQDYRAVQQAIENYRPAGIEAVVLPATRTTVDVDVTLFVNNTAFANQEAVDFIVKSIKKHLNNFTISQDLYVSALSKAVMDIEPTIIEDVSFKLPIANIITKPQELIRAGGVTVEFRKYQK